MPYVKSKSPGINPTVNSMNQASCSVPNQGCIGVDSALPQIEPLPPGMKRPLWSVMIPTYNCARYLRETLRSVLAQDLGPNEMQIEVVDDCSTLDEPAAVVEEEGKGRVLFFRKQTNDGAIKNFNTCIERSKGHLVHILHGDDYICPGYYNAISNAAALNPQIGLISARCFIIDEDSEISGVFQRVKILESAGRSVVPFLYSTPIAPAGVTVRREAYERLGGYRLDLVHAADCELFARIVAEHGGVILKDILAYYRVFEGNDTSRLRKTAENIRDICRINELFAERYAEFSVELARERAIGMARHQYFCFLKLGDEEALVAHHQILIELLPFFRKCKWQVKNVVLRFVRWLSESRRGSLW